ncbi:MAG: YidC/Oxa1 family insertase periplasmic-domain containing protein [Planctomycetes bacterium]|nr:YidC/Oxa1 family insertase periplasmic-domain containing protein [Planctomycetota bacterium]
MTRLSLVLLALFGVAPLARAQNGAQEPVSFEQQFGEPGTNGSLRAGFSRRGAALKWLQLTDHYPTVAQRDQQEHKSGDYLLLVDDPTHALRLTQRSGATFAVDPSTADWTREPIADGVKFVLADGKGLVLEKVLHYQQELRGFTLELTLRNQGSDLRGNLELSLNGPTLFSPAGHSSTFLDVSAAIATSQDGTVASVKPKPGEAQVLEIDPRTMSFAGSTNRFFAAFLSPLDDTSRSALTRLDVDTLAGGGSAEHPAAPTARVLYGLSIAIPDAGQAVTLRYGLYFGPKSYRIFDAQPELQRYAPVLDVDLTAPCCLIEVPLGKQIAWLLLKVLGFFHDLLGNWGFAVILLTIVVRSSLFPINFHMQKSMRKFGAKMAKLKPKMEELKKKHADDPKAYQQAMLQFNREHGVMPPLGGCLPMFLTMPIYIGLFTALRTAYDLRQQPFLGWIDDLSTSDALVALPFWPGVLNLLPLLWIALFMFMTLRQPLPTDPQQRQMQQMMRFMPLIFAVMLYNYASALLLYMVTSMTWSLIESTIVKKILGPVDPSAAGMAPAPMM